MMFGKYEEYVKKSLDHIDMARSSSLHIAQKEIYLHMADIYSKMAKTELKKIKLQQQQQDSAAE